MRQKSANSEMKNSKMGRIGDRPLWMRHLSVPVRALHLVGAAVVLAASLLHIPEGAPQPYLWMAVVTGLLLLGADALQHRQLLRELTGVVTLVKILVFGAAFHGFIPFLETTLLVFIAAAITAHAPKHVRHRLLL